MMKLKHECELLVKDFHKQEIENITNEILIAARNGRTMVTIPRALYTEYGLWWLKSEGFDVCQMYSHDNPGIKVYW